MSSAPLSEDSRHLRLELCELAARYHAMGWLFGTSGNLSGRFAAADGVDRVVITASGRDKGRLGPEDFVEVPLSGPVTRSGDRKPSAETSIHLAVYAADPSARAVLHVHTVASTLLRPEGGAPGEIDFQGREMVKGWGRWEPGAHAALPFFPNHPEVPRISEEISDWLSEPNRVPALVIEDHGITAWGEDLRAAHRHLEVTEFLCRLALADRSQP